jgi:hypothetical protein
MDPDPRLAAHAEGHHGVFRGAHARLAGLSPRQVVDRVAAGRWIEVYRDVYRLAGVPPSWRGSLVAATWAGGFRALASRRSAAALHELPGGRRDLVEITTPRWRRPRHKGLVVHETKALDPVDITIVDGIAVTTPARTLFDLGAEYRIGFVELAVENALRRRLVSLAELDRTVRRLSRPGRPGGVTLRTLVEARASCPYLIATGWLPIDIGPDDLRTAGSAALSAIATALASRRCTERTSMTPKRGG